MRGLASVVERLAASDPSWLAAARRDAWARFEAAPLPSRVEHLWRYTDPASLMPGARIADAPSGHFGLLGMKERTELIGGKLEVKSEAGVGTQVSVRLPVI